MQSKSTMLVVFVRVITTMIKCELEKKRLIWLILPDHNTLLKIIRQVGAGCS